MSAPSSQTNSREETNRAKFWLWMVLAILVCGIAISGQSLWIDEALTAAKASAGSFADWWSAMLVDKASDLQMPLYMIYVWGFAKIFGTSEWALRAANIPWFVMGVATLVRGVSCGCGQEGGPGRRLGIVFGMVALTSPFAWFYLDEARPYAMQLGASCLIMAGLWRLSSSGKDFTLRTPHSALHGLVIFLIGLVALSGSSMLGMIWAGAACLSLPIFIPREQWLPILKANVISLVSAIIVLAALAGYYLWTVKIGARASDVGKTDARNAVFIVYEILGLGGLGPARLAIRDGGLGAFKPFAVPLICLGGIAGGWMLAGMAQLFRRAPRRRFYLATVVLLLPVIFIFSAGVFMHFRVLGRHFAPLWCVVILVIGIGIEKNSHKVGKIGAVAFVVLSVWGCLALRFAARHRKDDYRGAANVARISLEQGRVVWWNAGREGAMYYQVPLAEIDGQSGRAVWLMNPDAESLARLPLPQIIVASKPDVYDGGKAVGEFIQRGSYVKRDTLAAFIIWEK